jgi:hypothetical protein
MRPHFSDPDVWTGGFYELCLELPAQDDATTTQALAALWGSPQLSGCFMWNDSEPTQQVALMLENLPVEGHLYGVATLGDGQDCVCGSYTTQFADEGRWLGFYLPMSALAKIYPVGGYPFGRATPHLEHTLKAVNEWLRTLAEGVYQHSAFTFGIIGFETDFSAMKVQALQAIPEERWDGLLIPADDHLLWYPPTKYGTQFT